jgi:hypothetical protein
METLLNEVKNLKAGQFQPRAYYAPEGDSLSFYFKRNESYGERIDNFLTVFKSFESHELTGCQVKGLPHALAILGNFGIDFYQGGRLKLSLLFMAFGLEAESKNRDCYKILGKIAAEQDVEFEPPAALLHEDASLSV